MTTQTEALKLALECAERCESIDGMYSWADTITAIKEALAVDKESLTTEAQQSVTCVSNEQVEPVAWMVPKLVTFKDCEFTNAPKKTQERLEGTVAWYPMPFGDTPPVADKNGVTHHPRPLVYGDTHPSAPTAQPEQEPDVYIPADALRQLKGTSLLILRSVPLYGYRGDGLIPLYTTPPQRKPLTDERIADIVIEMNGNEPTALFWRDLAQAIEAAHGIKGDA